MCWLCETSKYGQIAKVDHGGVLVQPPHGMKMRQSLWQTLGDSGNFKIVTKFRQDFSYSGNLQKILKFTVWMPETHVGSTFSTLCQSLNPYQWHLRIAPPQQQHWWPRVFLRHTSELLVSKKQLTGRATILPGPIAVEAEALWILAETFDCGDRMRSSSQQL